MASSFEQTEAALRIIHQPEAGNYSIDVVLVEGLGSQHSRMNLDLNVPTEQDHIHDLLRGHISNARIFTYSPPSRDDGYLDPLFSVEGLTRAAEALLRKLYEQSTNDRSIEESKKGTLGAGTESVQVSRTPLAFIAHDLGGAIVKKALVIAANSRMYHELSMAATRLIFFGTPHNAPDLTSWENALLNVFLSFPRDFASPIPKDLATRARSLAIFFQTLSDQFCSTSSRCSVVSVYQQSEQGSLDQTVSSGLICETGIPRNVEIHGLSWFSNDEKTSAMASAITSTIKGEQSSEAYRACLDILYNLSPPISFTYQGFRGLFHGLPLYTTSLPAMCNSIAPSNTITAVRFAGFWDEPLGYPIGIAPQFLKLKHSGEWQRAAYFSFSGAMDCRRSTAVAFLSSVAFQILDQDPTRFARVQELFAAMRESNAWTQPALSVLLSSLLDASDTVSDTQYILIDGLDNCDGNSRKSLLDLFVSIVKDNKSRGRLKLTFSVQEMAADIEEALSEFDEALRKFDDRAIHKSLSTYPSETIMKNEWFYSPIRPSDARTPAWQALQKGLPRRVNAPGFFLRHHTFPPPTKGVVFLSGREVF